MIKNTVGLMVSRRLHIVPRVSCLNNLGGNAFLLFITPLPSIEGNALEENVKKNHSLERLHSVLEESTVVIVNLV